MSEIVNGVASKPARAGLVVLALAAVLCVLPCAVVAQQATVQGMVTSSATGSPLEGVTIILEFEGQQVKFTFTDRNGFYQIGGIQPGAHSLRGQQIGFTTHEIAVNFTAGEQKRVNFRMDTEAVQLERIVIPRETGAAARELGRQVVTPGDIRRVPVPAGAGDLASYLQTLPGVATTSDRGGQMFVRGGTPAENLILVDGIPIYQPFHIPGFFSVFAQDLVSSADFYAGGFGARYSGRTASVLDVRLRDGDPRQLKGVASLSPFVAEALAEGPAGSSLSWIVSARRSLIMETSGPLLGQTQPYAFDSQMLKLTTTDAEDMHCSALALRTADRGRLDPDETGSHIAWQNLLVGARCVKQFQRFVRLTEVSFSFSSFRNEAIDRGSAMFRSGVHKMGNEAHLTSMIGTVPLYAGYHLTGEFTDYDLTELFGIGTREDDILRLDGYVEASLPLGGRIEARPGVVLVGMPVTGIEPRIRASWQPFHRNSGKLQAAFGVYRQNLVGVSDIRDVTSAFTAWMAAPDHRPLRATHGSLGWQQSLGDGVRLSAEAYYKRMRGIPVSVWRATASFTTQLTRADGTAYGTDTRIEFRTPRFYAFVGHGYSSTEYRASQAQFASWYGEPVQSYHPPHDRRHQVNAVASADAMGFEVSARWQFGSGLPFTRPLGFDEAFDYRLDLYDPGKSYGSPRVLLDRPFNARLPMVHRLDLAVKRGLDLSIGRLEVQAGAINAYDRPNMFYYDLYTARRVDQLPLAPYASLTLRHQ